MTDSVETQPVALSEGRSRLRGRLFGEAIRRIARGERFRPVE